MKFCNPYCILTFFSFFIFSGTAGAHPHELGKMNPEESRKWEVVRELPVESPFNTTTSNYSEDEFLEKLKTDEEFNKRWGKLKNS